MIHVSSRMTKMLYCHQKRRVASNRIGDNHVCKTRSFQRKHDRVKGHVSKIDDGVRLKT